MAKKLTGTDIAKAAESCVGVKQFTINKFIKFNPTQHRLEYIGTPNFKIRNSLSLSERYFPSSTTGGYPFNTQGNCTWYAYCRSNEILGKTCALSGLGNAEDWYNNSKLTYSKGQTPQVGAICCWADGKWSGKGHVAVVEKIIDNEHIKISESGWNAFWFRYSDCYFKNGGWTKGSGYESYKWQGFIYNPGVVSSEYKVTSSTLIDSNQVAPIRFILYHSCGMPTKYFPSSATTVKLFCESAINSSKWKKIDKKGNVKVGDIVVFRTILDEYKILAICVEKDVDRKKFIVVGNEFVSAYTCGIMQYNAWDQYSHIQGDGEYFSFALRWNGGDIETVLNLNPNDSPGGAFNDTSQQTQELINKYTKKYAGTPDGNALKIYLLLKAAGYSHNAVCAILGNIKAESGYDPAKHEVGGEGIGLVQWTWPAWKNEMISYVSKRSSSGSWEDLEGQVSYIIYGLDGNGAVNKSAVKKYLKDDSHTLDEMTEYFCWKYENPAVSTAHLEWRKEEARNKAKQFQELAGISGSGGAGHVSDGSLDGSYDSGSYSNGALSEWNPLGMQAGTRKEYAVTVNYKEMTQKVKVDEIVTATGKFDHRRGTNLLSYPTLVESPFIILKVGDYTFGKYTKSGNNKLYQVNYPNYMDSLRISKVNGTVNQYTIRLVYQIEAGQDPNLLDKIFSTIADTRTVYISYGDWNAPSFIYKEEEALLTKLTSNVDFSSSRITYELTCTSNAIALMGTSYSFKGKKAKPSDIIRKMLKNNECKITDIFTGMKNMTNVELNKLIPSNDIQVEIDGSEYTDPVSYINYLVSCMNSGNEDPNTGLKSSTYYMTIHDDTTGDLNLKGTYFKITEVSSGNANKALSSADIYEVDVGFPGDNFVTDFSIRTDNSWAMLFDYNQKITQQNYSYSIDDNGKLVIKNSPNIMTSSTTKSVNETQKSWWTQMTQFPINASLTIKGLIRPSILMTYVRVNAMFYGQRHVSSGLYAITRQDDSIDASGYKTTLTLLRIAGDDDYIKSTTKYWSSKIPISYTFKQTGEFETPGNPNLPDGPRKVDTLEGNPEYREGLADRSLGKERNG